MALRWRKDKAKTGIRAVCAGSRSSTLNDGDIYYATVSALSVSFHKYSGWYWTARNDDKNVPLKNTCNDPCETEAEAKKQAMEYVKKHIKANK